MRDYQESVTTGQTHGWTDAGQSDPYVPLFFAGDTKNGSYRYARIQYVILQWLWCNMCFRYVLDVLLFLFPIYTCKKFKEIFLSWIEIHNVCIFRDIAITKDLPACHPDYTDEWRGESQWPNMSDWHSQAGRVMLQTDLPPGGQQGHLRPHTPIPQDLPRLSVQTAASFAFQEAAV